MLLRAFPACLVLLLSRQSDAAPTSGVETSATDLDGSATGYVYHHQQQGLPVYYVQYTNHGSGQHYHAPDAVRYVVEGAAVAPVAHAVPEATPILLPYATAKGALHSLHQGTVNYGDEQSLTEPVKSAPRAPYHVDGGINVEEDRGRKEEDHGDGEGEDDQGDGVDEKIHGGFGGSAKQTGHAAGYGHGGVGESQGNEGSVFEAGNGEKQEAEKYSETGEKGVTGYESRKKFSEGERGSDDSEHKEGYYKNRGGHKKGHVDEAEKHGSHEEAEKGKEGGSYGHSSYHKKGHKTNGFHNVYHKDEYKKETDFYDDDHKKGHFEEHEEFDKGYKSGEGGSEKGGHHSSGHDYQDNGKKGYYDKGHHDSQDQGHRAEEGEKSYYANHENYGAEKDSKSSRTHKFSEKDR